jgi:hypothetical protein
MVFRVMCTYIHTQNAYIHVHKTNAYIHIRTKCIHTYIHKIGKIHVSNIGFGINKFTMSFITCDIHGYIQNGSSSPLLRSSCIERGQCRHSHEHHRLRRVGHLCRRRCRRRYRRTRRYSYRYRRLYRRRRRRRHWSRRRRRPPNI